MKLIFIYINESLFFLTDLLGYMIIQIFYKQLLLTHIYIQGDRHEYDSRAYAP
jgi:hypothetical protein